MPLPRLKPDFLARLRVVFLYAGKRASKDSTSRCPGMALCAPSFIVDRAAVALAKRMGSAIVFKSGVHVRVFGLDVTKKRKVLPEDFARWKESASPLVRAGLLRGILP